MSSPEGSLLLLTVLLYFPPAASAAILARGGTDALEETKASVVIDRAESPPMGEEQFTELSNRWSEEAGLRLYISKPDAR